METQQPTTKTDRKPTDWREARRLRAWTLKQKGWKQTTIAQALGVTDGALSQWVNKAKQHGVEALYSALYSRKHPGPRPALSPDDLDELPKLLAKGAQHYGFRGNRWTRARVRKVIQEHFSVCYSKQHVGRLLAQIGWTPQKPNERAAQRDEQAIERWRDEQWQRIKKSQSGRPHDRPDR